MQKRASSRNSEHAKLHQIYKEKQDEESLEALTACKSVENAVQFKTIKVRMCAVLMTCPAAALHVG